MKGETVSLRFKSGSSDKVYNINLTEVEPDAWLVSFEYGRFGSALNVGTKTPKPVSHGEAHKIFDKIIKEKVGKGYKPDNKSVVSVYKNIVEPKSTGFLPQLLNEVPEEELEKYLNDDGWCAQEKFDGRNRLLIKEGDSVIGANRKGLEVAIPDEVVKEVKSIGHDLVISGEAIGDYVQCFDIISMKASYFQRYKHLHSLLAGNTKVRAIYTAWDTADKKLLLRRLKKSNAEGIVFKHKDAYYHPGRPASGGSQLKFKFCATASVLVGDINKGKRSVEMWVLTEDKSNSVNIGNVTIYPNQEIPKKGSVIEVKYLYAYKGGSLFQPVLLSERDDLDHHDCTIDQLKYKKED